MKFGKVCEEACIHLESQVGVPAFPYKMLKKKLKAASVAKSDGRQEFARVLQAEVQSVDAAWRRAVRSVLKTVCEPRVTAVLAMVGLTRRRPRATAPALAEWSALARTGLRKIKKKYNKRLGAKFGPLEEVPNLSSFAFVASLERTEIEVLASAVVGDELAAAEREQQSSSGHDSSRPMMSPNGKPPPGAALASSGDMRLQLRAAQLDRAKLECPVCMEIMFDPVAPACGHAMCRACFDGISDSGVVMRVPTAGGVLAFRPASSIPACPICREPAASVKPMSVLASLCKAADPNGFAARKRGGGGSRSAEDLAMEA